jgi:oxygen-independent coproporphyrinogen-3 oxidase
MCQGRVEFESIELAHLVKVPEVFATEIERLRELQRMGLVQMDDREVQVTATGWYFIRAIAMVFDRHLQSDRARERFSRII